MQEQQDLITRLRTRASIRRNIQTRKSVQEGQPDRIAELLEEAAEEIYWLRIHYNDVVQNPERIQTSEF